MPTIRFTADPKLPVDLAHLDFRKDQEHSLSRDSCERWIRRGVAVYVQDADPEIAPVPVELPPVEPDEEPADVEGALDEAAQEVVDEVQTEVTFDVDTATVEELRDFLIARGVTPHHRTGEARLREMVAEAMVAQ